MEDALEGRAHLSMRLRRKPELWLLSCNLLLGLGLHVLQRLLQQLVGEAVGPAGEAREHCRYL